MSDSKGVAAGTADTDQGHHIEDGRNVVSGDPGSGGQDVFHAAVQMSRMPMCLADPHAHDCPLVFVNRAFERLTGYSKEDVLGRNCRFLQGDGSAGPAVDAIADAIKHEQDISVEILNYRKDGSQFWNALYLSPVFNEAGKLLYFFASQLDVTRRRQAEAVLQRSQRMEAMGSMAASVAHEINNLMTVVAGSLEQAGMHPSSTTQVKQIDRANWGVEQTSRLVQQMLSFSRRQFHNTRPADLGSLVRGMDSLLTQVAGAGIRLDIQLAAEPLPILIDVGQLELALLNLVRNAVDAMPSGGTLTVGTRARGGQDAGRMAVVSVSDTGVGMTPDVHRQATEPFFTTKDRGKGTGLGLSMVQGFVDQSDGQLEIRSHSGHGTRVAMLFPICSQ